MKQTYIFLLLAILGPRLCNASTGLSDFQTTAKFDKEERVTMQNKLANTTPILMEQIPWIPIEAFTIGVLISLAVYYRPNYHDHLEFTFHIIRRTQTPLTVLQNLLETIATDNLPKVTSNKIKQAIGCTNQVMNCYQNVIAFDKKGRYAAPELKPIETEIYTFIDSIIKQCRTYAEMRNIQLIMNESQQYVNCQIDEVSMRAALQCLLNKVIETTPQGRNITIRVFHIDSSWSLKLSNSSEDEKEYGYLWKIHSLFTSINNYGSLWAIRKVIHRHGGKINVNSYEQTVCFHIIIPMKGNSTTNNKIKILTSTRVNNEGEMSVSDLPHILLIMDDKEMSNYLKDAFSFIFRITIIEETEHIFHLFNDQHPDIIIIDEMIGGTPGNNLCTRIKSDQNTIDIPVILLINNNENYFTHIHCGADRLILRRINISQLCADIHVLITHYRTRHNRMNDLPTNNSSDILPKLTSIAKQNIMFMNKVQNLIEENLTTEGYTLKTLSIDMGMSRTGLYNKIKQITGEPPTDYIHTYKMNKAKKLLATQQYTITEIANILGYCDAKYFGKRFKDFSHKSPTQYIKDIEE